MNNAPAVIAEIDAPMSEDVVRAYMDSLFKDMTMPQAIAFARMANQKGLNWEARQVYPTVLQGRVVPITSIDGFLVIAERTGQFGGIINSRLFVKTKDGSKVEVPIEQYDPEDIDHIISATVEVVRRDWSNTQPATAIFRSYNQPNRDIWRRFPERMILKCAESLALRKSFPQDLSGLYTTEEMAQADQSRPLSVVKPAPAPAPNPVEVKPGVVVEEVKGNVDEPGKVIDVEPEPTPKPKKSAKMTIPQIIAGIPKALRARKPDVDVDIFPFCENFVLTHFGVESAEDIPEERREEVIEFLKNDMVNHLKEHGEL